MTNRCNPFGIPYAYVTPTGILDLGAAMVRLMSVQRVPPPRFHAPTLLKSPRSSTSKPDLEFFETLLPTDLFRFPSPTREVASGYVSYAAV